MNSEDFGAPGLGESSVLRRQQLGEPSARAEMKAALTDGDMHAGIFRRAQRVFDRKLAFLPALPRRVERNAQCIRAARLLFGREIRRGRFMAIHFDANVPSAEGLAPEGNWRPRRTNRLCPSFPECKARERAAPRAGRERIAPRGIPSGCGSPAQEARRKTRRTA